jgi:hypothetical protein
LHGWGNHHLLYKWGRSWTDPPWGTPGHSSDRPEKARTKISRPSPAQPLGLQIRPEPGPNREKPGPARQAQSELGLNHIFCKPEPDPAWRSGSEIRPEPGPTCKPDPVRDFWAGQPMPSCTMRHRSANKHPKFSPKKLHVQNLYCSCISFWYFLISTSSSHFLFQY